MTALAPSVPRAVLDLPQLWRARVTTRRELTRADAAADALEIAANELDRAIETAIEDSRLLTTTEYGRVRRVSPATARKWCLRGELPGAVQNEAGVWFIPSTAVRKYRRRARG